MSKIEENWALNAFADGELEAEERVSLQKLLTDCEITRKAFSSIQQQKSDLHNAYNSTLHETLPPSLIAATSGYGMKRFLPLAAMFAFLMLSGAGGWFAAQNMGALHSTDLASRALIAHQVYAPEMRHPVEVAANEREDLRAWLSKRVGATVTIPALDFHGYQFLGGRLLASDNGPAGQLMFENIDKQRLTIFVTANLEQKDEALRLVAKDGLVTCYWRDGALAVAITGDLSREAMTKLGTSVYDQMEIKS
jgi:anti-sigma factor RsiW